MFPNKYSNRNNTFVLSSTVSSDMTDYCSGISVPAPGITPVAAQPRRQDRSYVQPPKPKMNNKMMMMMGPPGLGHFNKNEDHVGSSKKGMKKNEHKNRNHVTYYSGQQQQRSVRRQQMPVVAEEEEEAERFIMDPPTPRGARTQNTMMRNMVHEHNHHRHQHKEGGCAYHQPSRRERTTAEKNHGPTMADKCTSCKSGLLEGVPFVIDRNQNRYHEECFTCIHCSNVIDDAQYKHTDKGPVCIDCGLPECHHCENLILGDVLVAKAPDGTPLDFHTQCLKCINCASLITEKYKAGKEGFLCEVCSNPKCSTCDRFIAGGSQYFLKADTSEPICPICHAASSTVVTTHNAMTYDAFAAGPAYHVSAQNTVSAPNVIVAPPHQQVLGQVSVKPVAETITVPQRQVVQTQVLPVQQPVVQVAQAPPVTYTTYTTSAQPQYLLSGGGPPAPSPVGLDGGFIMGHEGPIGGRAPLITSPAPHMDTANNFMVPPVNTSMVPPGGHVVRTLAGGGSQPNRRRSSSMVPTGLMGPFSGPPPHGATIVPAHPAMKGRPMF